MDDTEEEGRKIVILHEPRSSRVVGFTDSGFLGVGGSDLQLETPMDYRNDPPGHNRGALEEVTVQAVAEIDANLGLAVPDSVFEDTEFAENVDADLEDL